MPDYRVDASRFEAIEVSGIDAERFLQGQLTCDLAALTPEKISRGAICTNKGRVVTPFVICRKADTFLLLFNQGLASLFLAAMKKFLPFYKCKMEIADMLCTGLAVARLPDLLKHPDLPLPEPGQLTSTHDSLIVCLANQPARFLVVEEVAAALLDPEKLAKLALDPGPWWLADEMQDGHFPFATGDAERFTPQELHFDRNGYVSFDKGCYTGQEIVARMHYRGKLKKQFFLVELDAARSDFPAASNNQAPELLDDTGKVLTTCIKPLEMSNGSLLALVELPIDFPTDIKMHCSGAPATILRQF